MYLVSYFRCPHCEELLNSPATLEMQSQLLDPLKEPGFVLYVGHEYTWERWLWHFQYPNKGGQNDEGIFLGLMYIVQDRGLLLRREFGMDCKSH